MPAPTVFVSSSFYDLRYIRENLKRFIEQLGYVPILSEEGAVYYDPKTSAAESCISDIPNAQLFVLIIGGRFGSTMPNSQQSVTNAEYQQAVHEKVPVFALVDQGTYNDFQLYRHNVDKKELLNSIRFPNADSTKIFDFINQVQSASVNNALFPFRTYNDIEAYLRSQSAGMVYSFLTKTAESMKVVDSLAILETISTRTEVIAEQILRNVGQIMDQLVVDFLQRMLVSQAVSDMRYIKLKPTPADIVMNETFQECVTTLFGRPFEISGEEDEEGFIITGSGKIARFRLDSSEKDYNELREHMLSELAKNGVSLEDFYAYKFSRDVPLSSPIAKPAPRRRTQRRSPS